MLERWVAWMIIPPSDGPAYCCFRKIFNLIPREKRDGDNSHVAPWKKKIEFLFIKFGLSKGQLIL
jgi:hypothetical protein